MGGKRRGFGLLPGSLANLIALRMANIAVSGGVSISIQYRCCCGRRGGICFVGYTPSQLGSGQIKRRIMNPPLFYVLTINSDEPAPGTIFDRFIKNNLVNIWLTGTVCTLFVRVIGTIS